MAHHPLAHYLSTEHSNTFICTSAGVICGMAKAGITLHLLNITFDGSFTVAAYATIATIAAYFTRETIAWLQKKDHKKRKHYKSRGLPSGGIPPLTATIVPFPKPERQTG